MQRFRPLALIIVLLIAVGVLMAFSSPSQPAPSSSPWAPTWSEANVQCELRAGCQHLVSMVAAGSPDAAWAVDRLQVAIRTRELGPEIHAMAERGLALAKR